MLDPATAARPDVRRLEPAQRDPWPRVRESFTAAERGRRSVFDETLAVPAGVPPYWLLRREPGAPDG